MKPKTEIKKGRWLQFKKILALRAGVLLLCLAAASGKAQMHTVTNCTEAALRAAMAGGGTVTFACDGTISLGSTITNAMDTVLDGSGHHITISGNNANRVFFVNSNVNFTTLNLTIANGRSDKGAGIYNAGGNLAVQNCIFIGNTALGQAGVSGNPGTNGTDGCGGALFNAGVATIADSTFSTNVAVGGAGGGGYTIYNGPGTDGSSGGFGYGGAICNSGEVTLTNCSLNGNTAAGGAGGNGGNTSYAPEGGDRNGGSGGAGGSSYGGALFNGGVAELANTTLAENASTGGSGGAGGGGGGWDGVYNGGNGGNGNAGGSGSGGGIYDLTSNCFLTNCTLALNSAIAGGGGAAGYGGAGGGSPGLPGLAGSASGGGINTNSSAFLINVLLASNTPGNGSGSIIDGGYNLSSDNSCGFTNVGSLNNSNPLLGPLMDNGGPTLTMALMPGSPAIDAGDTAVAPPTDQRGFPRPVGSAADIGAYECGSPGIITLPQSQMVVLGSTVDFSATAAGYPPLDYQWFFNGMNAIDGATNSVLELENLQLSQSGAYTVVVTNLFGSVTSSPALLDVYFRTVTSCTEAALRASLGLGGTVTFACDGTITLSNTIVNGTNIVLDGSGHQITISGGNLVRVFQVNSNVNFTLIDLTIANGLSTNGYGGGIYNAGGNVYVTNCTFFGNAAIAPYGGNPGREATGGAIYSSGVLNVSVCTFEQNSALGGAGNNNHGGVNPIPIPSYGNGGSGGTAKGGAIRNLGIVTIDRSLFANNTVAGGTGGGGANGGLESPEGPAYPGSAGGAGGDGAGGALFTEGAANLINCTFAWNYASGGAGGQGGNGGSCWWQGVHYWGYGGAGGNGGSGLGDICDPDGLATMTNCTVSDNVSTGGSGALGGTGSYVGFNGSNGTAIGSLSTTGTLLVNTILAGNSPGNCSGTIKDAGHNLSSDGTCAFTNVGSLNNTNPLLGPLADNGGPTLTMALLPGSPAINAGDTAAAPPTDQRGFPRPSGLAADIGAYEYFSPTLTPIQSQTVEMGSSIECMAVATGDPVLSYQWFLDGNAINGATNAVLDITNVQFSQSGSYTVVVTNCVGAVTSAPVMLNVISVVERRPVPGINLTGDVGSSLHVEYCNALGLAPNWLTLDTLTLTNTSQFCFDVATPLPPERFYRAWQTGTPSVVPSLNLHYSVPAITLTGNVGDSLQLDYINQFGPTNAWVMLDTITLTNTSQLYFDVSAIGQPQRFYRIVPLP
ncbi:MAG: choice-of-anchor Q domain-containing protein [Verrucomicrobiota bacterium]